MNMLVMYSAFLSYPGGGPIASTPVAITLMGSNQASLLFTDATGTTPLPNPVMTDPIGYVEFFAAPGVYETDVAGEFIRIPIDGSVASPVWPDRVVHTQAVAAAVWTVNHFFGTQPSVDVIFAGPQVEAQIDHPSLTQTVITFTSPQSGTANLRR